MDDPRVKVLADYVATLQVDRGRAFDAATPLLTERILDSMGMVMLAALRAMQAAASDLDLPPPPEVVCNKGPYIVFFEWDRSDITPEAAGILDNAVSAYQSCGNASVMLAGHADRSGAASYNVGLSQRRADAVKGYLTSKAIPESVIATEAFGESRPRVETADGVREVQNRNVQITYGPGSGM